MKKVFAMMMVVLMVIGTMSANAELTYKTHSVESTLIGVKHTGEEVWDSRFYVEVMSEHGGEPQILEVSEEEYNEILRAEKKAEKKLADAQKPWYGKVASFCTFWNPND